MSYFMGMTCGSLCRLQLFYYLGSIEYSSILSIVYWGLFFGCRVMGATCVAGRPDFPLLNFLVQHFSK